MTYYEEIESDDLPPTLMHQRRHTDPFRQDKEIAIAKMKEYQQDPDKERALDNAHGEICRLLKAYDHGDLELEFRKIIDAGY